MIQTKYHNIPTEVHGLKFASRKEAARYQELLLLLRSGQIINLVCHPKYPLRVNGQLIGAYYGDFSYVDVATGKSVTEDAKGFRTSTYKLKKKLMLAIHGIDIVEV